MRYDYTYDLFEFIFCWHFIKYKWNNDILFSQYSFIQVLILFLFLNVWDFGFFDNSYFYRNKLI